MTELDLMSVKVTLLGLIYKSGNVKAEDAVKELEILMGAVKPAEPDKNKAVKSKE